MKVAKGGLSVQIKRPVLVTGVVVIVIIAALAGVFLLTRQHPGQPKAVPQASIEASAAAPAGEDATSAPSSLDGHDPTGEYGDQLGRMAHVGKLHLSVIKVAAGPTAADGAATTAVTFTATNKATTAVTIDPQSWSATDRSLGDVPQAAVAGAMKSAESVGAGQTITRTLYFEGNNIGRVIYSADDADAAQLTWRVK